MPSRRRYGADTPADLRAFSIRYEEVVFERELITATATVERTRSEEGSTIVDLSLKLEKEDGTVVLTGTAAVRTDQSTP